MEKLNYKEFNNVTYLLRSTMEKKADTLAHIEKRLKEEGKDTIYLGGVTLGEHFDYLQAEYYSIESALNKLCAMEMTIVE